MSETVEEKLRYSLTDLGNARRLADEHHPHLQHVPGVGFREYTGTRWIESESAGIRAATATIKSMYREAAGFENKDLRKLLVAHASACESAAKIKAMVELSKSQPAIEAPAAAFNVDPWLFNMGNGTFNLKTGKVQEHDPRDLITKQSPIAFDLKAKCPRWLSFLDRIFAGDTALIDYLQFFLGYSMTGDITEQIMPVGIGVGNNGKNVCMDTVAYILGDYCGPAPESLLLSSNQDAHPTDLADCEGMRLLFISETAAGRRWNLSRMKSLTGDSWIKARRMRENFYTFPRTHKMFLITNNAPRVVEDSEAVWRRLKRIPFDVVIPPAERDPKLLDILKCEASGILNWLILGCLEWRKNGLAEPTAIANATASYRAESDPLADFMEEKCTLGDGEWTSTGDLYRAYAEHTEASKERPLCKDSFGKSLAKYPTIKANRNGQTRGWGGIGLKTLFSTRGDDR